MAMPEETDGEQRQPEDDVLPRSIARRTPISIPQKRRIDAANRLRAQREAIRKAQQRNKGVTIDVDEETAEAAIDAIERSIYEDERERARQNEQPPDNP